MLLAISRVLGTSGAVCGHLLVPLGSQQTCGLWRRGAHVSVAASARQGASDTGKGFARQQHCLLFGFKAFRKPQWKMKCLEQSVALTAALLLLPFVHPMPFFLECFVSRPRLTTGKPPLTPHSRDPFCTPPAAPVREVGGHLCIGGLVKLSMR